MDVTVSCGGLAIDLNCKEAYHILGGVCDPGSEDGEWKEGLAGAWLWSTREKGGVCNSSLHGICFLAHVGQLPAVTG